MPVAAKNEATAPVVKQTTVPANSGWGGAKTGSPAQTATVATAPKADAKAAVPANSGQWGGSIGDASKSQANVPAQANAAAASAVQANAAAPSVPKVTDKATVPAGTGQWANMAPSKDNSKAAAPIAQNSVDANASKAPVMGKSDADKALYEKAKMSGNTFKSRDEAIAAVKAKDPEKFKTQFDTEPKVRPASIPSTTRVDNRDVVVVYDSAYHGYGYYGPNHIWVPYVVPVSDNDLRSGGVYYGPPPSGGHAMAIVLSILLLVAVVAVAVVAIQNRRNS